MKKKLFILTLLISFVLIPRTVFAEANEISKTNKEEVSISSIIEEVIPQEEEKVVVETETYRITYYCGCKSCCGKWSTNPPIVGAYGRELIDGYSCACPLPDGTEIEIKGYGIVRVDDTTSKRIVEKYNGKIIDIYVKDHKNKPKNVQDYMEIVVLEKEEEELKGENL